MRRLPEILFVFAAATVVVASPGRGAELYVGMAEADITHAQRTHTHTGPVFKQGDYKIPAERVVQPAEYALFFVDRVSEAAAKAWQARQRGAVAWGLGQAVVGQNRRVVYADGRAVMYGRTDQPDFRGLEGYEDRRQ